MKISIYRRFRASWISWELYRGEVYQYFRIGIANPNQHVWWATEVYFAWEKKAKVA